MLVKYVRDGRKPVATLVAIQTDDTIRIGVSICNEKDHFNRELGRHIAHERAMLGVEELIPNRIVSGVQLHNAIEVEVSNLFDRARRYFKPKLVSMT